VNLIIGRSDLEKENKTYVSIDGAEYVYEDMNQEQQLLINHVADLTRKLESVQFNLQQLQVGKDAFIQMLKQSLQSDNESQP